MLLSPNYCQVALVSNELGYPVSGNYLIYKVISQSQLFIRQAINFSLENARVDKYVHFSGPIFVYEIH